MGISSPYYPSVAVIPIWHIILGVYAPVLTYHLSISVSAAAFLDFYLSILDLLLTVWSELQPMHQVVIRYGNLGLEIGCSTEPIPWGIVKDFFATGRDKQYWHHKEDQWVARVLQIGSRVSDLAPDRRGHLLPVQDHFPSSLIGLTTRSFKFLFLRGPALGYSRA